MRLLSHSFRPVGTSVDRSPYCRAVQGGGGHTDRVTTPSPRPGVSQERQPIVSLEKTGKRQSGWNCVNLLVRLRTRNYCQLTNNECRWAQQGHIAFHCVEAVIVIFRYCKREKRRSATFKSENLNVNNPMSSDQEIPELTNKARCVSS